MKVVEEVTIAIALFAVIVSIFSTYVSVRTSTTLQSADYQAYQKLKADTARLLSTLRSIIHKAALATQGGNAPDLSAEKEYVNEFLSTTTAFAYHGWVAEQSKRASESGKKGEAWRIFFLQMAELSRADDPVKMGKIAADVELIFEDLSEEDLEQVASYLSDLPSGIRSFFEGREHDVLVQAFINVYASKSSDADSEKQLTMLQHLRRSAADDPDVDLLIASITGDTDLAKGALDRGANVSATLGKVFERHKEKLRELPE